MLMAAKREGHGEEGKRRARQEDGKEKLNDTHTSTSPPLCSGWCLGWPSLAQVFAPMAKQHHPPTEPHRLLWRSEHRRPHLTQKNGSYMARVYYTVLEPELFSAVP